MYVCLFMKLYSMKMKQSIICVTHINVRNEIDGFAFAISWAVEILIRTVIKVALFII